MHTHTEMSSVRWRHIVICGTTISNCHSVLLTTLNINHVNTLALSSRTFGRLRSRVTHAYRIAQHNFSSHELSIIALTNTTTTTTKMTIFRQKKSELIHTLWTHTNNVACWWVRDKCTQMNGPPLPITELLLSLWTFRIRSHSFFSTRISLRWIFCLPLADATALWDCETMITLLPPTNSNIIFLSTLSTHTRQTKNRFAMRACENIVTSLTAENRGSTHNQSEGGWNGKFTHSFISQIHSFDCTRLKRKVYNA